MTATTTTKRSSLADLDAYAEAFQAIHEDGRLDDTAPRVWAGVAHIGPPLYPQRSK
jgi:hypothetical protein